MAIVKKFLKSKPVCKVTFAFPETKASEISLVGDFNEWNTTTLPLKKLKNGTFKTVVDLEIEKSYEYKFFVDGEYLNDPEAEDLIFNQYANSENSLVKV